MKSLLKITLTFLVSLFLLPWASTSVSAQDIFWSQPAKISQSSNQALQPVVTSDSNGYVHAAWMEGFTGDYNYVFYSPPSRPTPGILYSFWNGDTWSSPVQVNSPAQGLAALPDIAVTSDDNIHVVWDEDSPSKPLQGQVFYRRYNGTTWGGIANLSLPIEPLDQTKIHWAWGAKIAADSSNNLHVLFSYWDETLGTSKVQIFYTKYNGSGWSTPANITQGLDVQFPALVVDSSGNVHVLLGDTPTGDIYYTFYNGSTWSGIQKINLSAFAMFPRLVIDGANNLHAAWYEEIYSEIKVKYARKPAAGAWSLPFAVSTTVAEAYWWMPLVGLTVDNSNNAYVGWGQYNTTWYDDIGRYGVDAMYRKYTVSTDTWSPPNLVRSTKYLDAPTIWRDKWWNQHFVWSEMNPSTGQWEFYYSEVPANTGSYSPTSALTITMVVTSDTLKLPANALAASATISAQVGPVPASRDPLLTTIPRSYTFRPHGTTFLPGKLATATIGYTDPELLGSNEAGMKVYIWDATLNGGLGGWSTSYTTSVNAGANRVTVDLAHFSLYGIMAPKAERKVNLTFRPPISNEELYTMVDGSTLPIKFTLAYENGATVTAPTSPEDIKVFVRKIVNGEIQETGVLEYKFGKGDNNVRYDPGNGQYLLAFKTRELNLGPGLYSVKVLHQGVNWGTTTFQITEPGKVKGAAAP